MVEQRQKIGCTHMANFHNHSHICCTYIIYITIKLYTVLTYVSHAVSLSLRIMKDLHENRIQIYTGEMDEEDDSPEMKQLKVGGAATVIGLKLEAYKCTLYSL